MTRAGTWVARLAGLTHSYGKTRAIDGIDLEIPAGCMAGFIGPDAVGKSTLLGLIAGVRKIQDGTVEVLGGDMRHSRHRTRVCPRIAYMPQGLGRNLYMTLSVFENVDFFGRLFGLGHRERAWHIEELLTSTGLAPFRNRPAGKLSGGMKQKLGLCCALIHDPDLLILDEPTTGVDPLSRRQFWELIDRIRGRRPDMSVLVATAYMEEAERFGWLAAINAGKVLATGNPAELKSRTGTGDLNAAFIELLPEEKRLGHKALVVPARTIDATDTPAIVAEGLTRRFGDFTAVDHVSFRIERGEIFGFLGSNGCGKTTTMKMLTGLLPASEGKAWLFGHRARANDLETRKRVGYMSQSFSLYSELTVRQNLELHARLYHLTKAEIPKRVAELTQRFGLNEHSNELAAELPLGIRQRLSLAVAVIHRPEMLILDEPTSGVDPVARDGFWELLVDLSRNQRVTIFIATHFMNEAERCDRISLMHAGKVLAQDSPAALVQTCGATNLEQAFITYLEQASGDQALTTTADATTGRPGHKLPQRARAFSLMRLLGYARREALEVRRDPIRLAFALFGVVLLMLIFGYGITMDVENVAYAALDRDRTPESRHYLENLTGSRYFLGRPAIRNQVELDSRMRNGELTLALEIPPGFGKDLRRGRRPEVSAWIDGAMPFRASTVRGYVQGLHQYYLVDLSVRTKGSPPTPLPIKIETRFRYNQDFKSVYAMVPADIALLLIFMPAILMAVSVVREKELGSITNLYATPVTRLEFLLGKQLPYVIIGMVNFITLVLMALFLFEVPLKGSFLALATGALLYIIATTGIGLLISSFTKTQIAAVFGAAILTLMPATEFSGMNTPVSSLDGGAAIVGNIFPATYFMKISVGTFTKGLGFSDLTTSFIALAVTIPVLLILSLVFLKKQEA